jgi:rhamnogalacturonan endolyase
MLAVLALLLTPLSARAQRNMEYLGRGVVALRQTDGNVFVSWRMLATEPADTTFDVHRSTGKEDLRKLNTQPLSGPTHFLDKSPPKHGPSVYHVRPAGGGDGVFTLPAGASAKPYIPIPLQTPPEYFPNDASVGDLDGDGEYDIVLHQARGGRDNSRRGVTYAPILQAYTLAGKLLWTIDLGVNIREGAHYTQFLVYDFDSDGRAEVVCKTADATTDARGVVIGDKAADLADDDGHVLRGSEFLTVFDGRTGAALATEKYVPARTENHPENPDLEEYRALWGDRNGNRGERYLACVAYLDGKRPSIVMCRGYYTRSTLAAWDYRDGRLTRRWLFDTGRDRRHPYAGQGNHNISVADVDADGRDEIVYGGMCIDDDGKGLWTTGLGHGDAMHVGDLDPTRAGLEMLRIQERFDDAGAHMVDVKTGQVLWRKPSVRAAESGGDRGEGPGRGVAFDIDPRHPGAESWTAGAGIEGVWNARGETIGKTKPDSCNFAVWWDGDELRELLNRNRISKWNWETQTTNVLLTAEGATSINGTKSTPCLSADILGDWREEVILPSTDGRELRVYTTTVPTERRIYTLMHDPQYRLSVAWQNVAYNQPPHTSFHIGPGMSPPPIPKIVPVRGRTVIRE